MTPALTRSIRRISELLLLIGAACGLVVLLGVVAGTFFGVRAVVITSGSMEPTISTGSLVLTRPVEATELRQGDVVTVPTSTNSLVTHRVESIVHRKDAATLSLQGDANQSPDPEPYTVGRADRMVADVPGVGYLLAALSSPAGLVALGAVAAVLVAFLARGGWRPDGQPRARRHAGGRRSHSGITAGSTTFTIGVVLIVISGTPSLSGGESSAAWTDPVVISGTTLATHTVASQATPACTDHTSTLVVRYSKLTWVHVDVRYEYAYSVVRVSTGNTVASGVITPSGAAGSPVELSLTPALLSLTIGNLDFDVRITARLSGAPSWTAAAPTVNRVHSENILLGLGVRCGPA